LFAVKLPKILPRHLVADTDEPQVVVGPLDVGHPRLVKTDRPEHLGQSFRLPDLNLIERVSEWLNEWFWIVLFAGWLDSFDWMVRSFRLTDLKTIDWLNDFGLVCLPDCGLNIFEWMVKRHFKGHLFSGLASPTAAMCVSLQGIRTLICGLDATDNKNWKNYISDHSLFNQEKNSNILGNTKNAGGGGGVHSRTSFLGTKNSTRARKFVPR
jgi:hypothetical protein